MTEIEAHLRAAVGAATPLGTMIGIDIENAVLLVIKMVRKIEQRIGVAETATHKPIVAVGACETRGLTEQRVDVEIGRDGRYIVGVMHLGGRESGLHRLRLGGNLAGLLHNGLKITLDGYIAVERRILGVHAAANRRRA